MVKTFDSSRAPEHGDDEPVPADLGEIDLASIRAALASDEVEKSNAARGYAAPAGITEEEAQGREEAARREGLQEGRELGRRAALSSIAGELQSLLDRVRGEAYGHDEVEEPEEPQTRASIAPVHTSSAAIASKASVVASKFPNHTSRVMPAKQRLLDALAWLESIGRRETDKTTLAFLSGSSASSSSFQNNLGSMRTEGLLDYPRSGAVALTSEGRRRANRPRAPLTTADLQAAIMDKLVPAHQRIVTTLIDAHPRALTKEALATKVGASTSSSSFQNNLGRLRSLGLLDYPKPGHVIAAPTLFLEARAA